MPRTPALAATSILLALTIAACGGGKDKSGTSSSVASKAPGTLTTGAPPQPAPSGGNNKGPVTSNDVHGQVDGLKTLIQDNTK